MKYVVITPVRNEELFIERTIASMVRQTVRPEEWIIVDDGSIDATPDIVKQYLPEQPWIRLLERDDRGFRELGRGVIDSFYDGLAAAKTLDFEFIVKLDGDLSFDPNYFEELFKRFRDNRKLGIASGSCYVQRRNKLVIEPTPASHTRGPTKVYKRQCWDDIGGLIRHLGWDTVDELKAQMLGWKTRSFNELKVIHHRPTAYAGGAVKGRIRQGLGAYYVGYYPPYMFTRAVRRMVEPPHIIGGLAMFWGFLTGYLKHGPRYEDPELRIYLRNRQIDRLLGRDRG